MKKADCQDKDIDIEFIKDLLEKDPQRRNVRDILQLSNEIKDISFFKKYQEEGYKDVHIQCAKFMRYCFIKKGEAVFHIDTVGDKFYLTLKGKVGIYIRLPKPIKSGEEEQEENKNNSLQLTCVKELDSGFSFGELALLNNKPRLATIICHQDSHFMTLDKLSFILILKQKEEERLFKEMGFFAKLPFFEGWNHNLIKHIYLNSFRIKYSKNEKIFNEGDEPANIYIVTEGEFVLQKGFDKNEEEDEFGFKQTVEINYLKKEGAAKKKQIPLAVLVQNEMFGEEDIMNKQKNRTYSAQCMSAKGECIVVKKRDFELRILSEEGARQYLETRLIQKNKYMQEKIQKIKGSIADYQNYLYDDRAEQKHKQQIHIAINRIESPTKKQNQHSTLFDFTSSMNDNESTSPYESKQISNNQYQHEKSTMNQSIIRKIENLTPTKRESSIIQSSSNLTALNNTSIEEKSSLIKLGSTIYKTKTIIELDKIEQQQFKDMALKKSSSIVEAQTPWRDQIASQKNINETFKNLFSFSGQDEEQTQQKNLLQVPSSQFKRKSKMSQTILISNSSNNLDGGLSPIQKRIIEDECASPIIIRRQLYQINTPISQYSTPNTMFNSQKRDYKGVQIPHIDTFSSQIKILSSFQVQTQQQQQNAQLDLLQDRNEQIQKQEEQQPFLIKNFERSNSMLSSSPLLKQKYEQIIKQKEQLKKYQEEYQQNIIQQSSILQNSLNYSQNTLSSQKINLDKNAQQDKQQLLLTKQIKDSLQQQTSQEYSDNQNSTKHEGLIKLRKSQDNIKVHFEEDAEEEGQESISQNTNCSLQLSRSKSQPKSPCLSQKASHIQNISKKLEQEAELNSQNKYAPQINVFIGEQENYEVDLVRKVDSLCEIMDDASSFKQSSDENNKSISNIYSRKSSNSHMKRDLKQLEQPLFKQNSTQSQILQQKNISQDTFTNFEEQNSSTKGKKLNLKIKQITYKTQEQLQNKIQNLENQFGKIVNQEPEKEQEQTTPPNQDNDNQFEPQQQANSNNKQIESSTQEFYKILKQNQPLLNQKIIFNSQFSPMKGRRNEHQPYKFEQYKDQQYYFKKRYNKNDTFTTGLHNSLIDLDSKIQVDGASPIKQRILKEGVQTLSQSPSNLSKNNKQITNYQKVLFQRQRVYNKSCENFKNEQLIAAAVGIFANQTVRTHADSQSASLSPQNNLRDFRSTRISQSQSFLLNLKSGEQDASVKQQQQQQLNLQIQQKNMQNPQQSHKKLPLLKQKIENTVQNNAFKNLIPQQKHLIFFENNIPITDLQKQKRYSAIRVYNKSEQKINSCFDLNSQDQVQNGGINEKQLPSQSNYLKVIQKIENHQQYIKQIWFPTSSNSESLTSTQKQQNFRQKMMQQTSSNQNISKSSINNPYSNLQLIQQHQQLHKYFNKHSELLKRVPHI
ncbi:hypothetical protein ABPG72_002892 [Tetrahymena utriculariae]